MKTTLITLVFAGIFAAAGCSAQNYQVRATSYDISDNLDLEAVSYIFGESRNLQDFEERLNDPRNQISNLDLNHDGYVDYLRVVEQNEYNMHLVTIQTVLDRNVFQDVATIDVERNNGGFYVQVIGDPYLYGPNYIIEPAYVRAPLIFTWFLRPSYVVWHSPYYWGYYPPRYRHYHCLPTYRYHRNLYVHVDYHVNTYHYVNVRHNSRAVEVQRQVSRNDYGRRHPDNSFSSRNKGYTNKYEMKRSRPESGQRRTVTGDSRPATNQSRNGSNSRYYDSNRSRSTEQPATTKPSDKQQKRSYENRNSQRQQDNSGYSKPSSSNNSGYQRNQSRSTNNSGSTNNSNAQKQVKSSSSSNQNNSGYRSSQSRQSQSSNPRKSDSNVRQSSRSPQQSADRKSVV